MARIMMEPEPSLFLSTVAFLLSSLWPVSTNTKHFSVVKAIAVNIHINGMAS
jgi:hypothetical protein